MSLLRDRLVRVASCCALIAILTTACGASRPTAHTLTVKPHQPIVKAVPMRYANVAVAADQAISRYDIALEWIGAVATTTTTTPSAPRSSFDWDCLMLREEAGNWHFAGPVYSSGGVLDEAVRENAPADVAARILAGTATRQEQIDMMQSIVDKHGVNTWAPSTVAACAR